MSSSNLHHDLQARSTEGLSVIQCGKRIRAQDLCVARRDMYDDYVLTFVIDGQGCFFLDQLTYSVGKGHGFCIFPGTPVSYIADEEDPWQYIYVIIKGNECKELMEDAGLSREHPMFSFDMDGEIPAFLQSMYDASDDYRGKGYDVTGYLLLIMSLIIRNVQEKPHRGELAYYESATSYIESNYAYAITVEDIAAHAFVEPSYLHRIFKKHTGTSPGQYLNEYRLKQAINLMKTTSHTIMDIALSVGFYDLSHFTRIFQKKFGIPPGKYRKMVNDTNENQSE